MAVYFVRWYDPARPAPLRRDFHSKREAAQFRDRLPYLADPPTRYKDLTARSA